MAAAVYGITVLFLFARLGHYAFWDDEALTALSAEGVLRTGDTMAVLGHNIVAYGEGLLLKNGADRSTPPLPAYVTAAAFAIGGINVWVARAPFALCGLALVGLMLGWGRPVGGRTRGAASDGGGGMALLALGILGNVSLFLFCRQCRYYAVAMLCTATVAWLYVRGRVRSPSGPLVAAPLGERTLPTRGTLLAMAAASLGLLASNYVQFAALYACLTVDYLLWGRRERRLSWREWTLLLGPQLVLGGIVVGIWNSASTGKVGDFLASGFGERLKYAWWSLRDLNICEFGVVWLLLAAPVLYRWRRNLWLLRLPLALGVYILAVAMLSTFKSSVLSQVRFLCPTIPGWIALGVLVIGELFYYRLRWVLPVGLVFFCTNLLSFNWVIPFPYEASRGMTPYPYVKTELRSTVLLYARELLKPPPDPYRLMGEWMRQNLEPGQSVWVAPSYAAYPLMFQMPEVIYAWQLTWPPKEEFRTLPEIHFGGRQPPDWIIGFDGHAWLVPKLLNEMAQAGIRYRAVPGPECFGRDVFRPELFLRSFAAITGYDKRVEGIYIFRREAPGAAR